MEGHASLVRLVVSNVEEGAYTSFFTNKQYCLSLLNLFSSLACKF